ncbi:MAG: SLC13 family permease, partial [Bacteroidales bacterium]|nr:SLC13 family permease [Bacteroidales bacterium]
MNGETIIVFITLLFILVSLYWGFFGPAFTFIIAVVFLAFCNILEPNEVLAGFANDQVAVVIILLLLGDIVRKTTIIEKVFDRLFIYARSYHGFLLRMMILVAGFSSILNNTPIVAVMMPYVHNWCKKNNFSPSKFLIPLSYAAILGGSVTLIGTSTNLIVNSMVKRHVGEVELKPLEMFDFIYVGIPMVVIGFIYLMLIGHRLLPGRKKVTNARNKSGREYFIETRIRSKSKYIGKTIEEAELKNYKGLFLIEFIRDGIRVKDLENGLKIEENDILIYAGESEKIADLVDSGEGLVISELGMYAKKKMTRVSEIVVSQNSILIGKRLKEMNFRAKYDATVLAIH